MIHKKKREFVDTSKSTHKRKFTYGAEGIPVVIGHNSCTRKQRLPLVPKKMGWLWNLPNMPYTPYRPGWEPGALSKFVYRIVRRSHPTVKSDVNIPQRRFPKHKQPQEGLSAHFDTISKPAFLLQKKDGNYLLNMQSLKDVHNQFFDSSHGYGKPFLCQVINKTPEEAQKHKKLKDKLEKHIDIEVLRLAFDNICNEIYHNLNKQDLTALAKHEGVCHCQIVQAEIINNLLVCDCYECYEEVQRMCASSTTPSVMSNTWSVEYNPACATIDLEPRKKPIYVHKGTLLNENTEDFKEFCFIEDLNKTFEEDEEMKSQSMDSVQASERTMSLSPTPKTLSVQSEILSNSRGTKDLSAITRESTLKTMSSLARDHTMPSFRDNRKSQKSFLIQNYSPSQKIPIKLNRISQKPSLTHNRLVPSEKSYFTNTRTSISKKSSFSPNRLTPTKISSPTHNRIILSPKSSFTNNRFTPTKKSSPTQNLIIPPKKSSVSHKPMKNSSLTHNCITLSPKSSFTNNRITPSQKALTHNQINISQKSSLTFDRFTPSQKSSLTNQLTSPSQESSFTHRHITPSQRPFHTGQLFATITQDRKKKALRSKQRAGSCGGQSIFSRDPPIAASLSPYCTCECCDFYPSCNYYNCCCRGPCLYNNYKCLSIV